MQQKFYVPLSADSLPYFADFCISMLTAALVAVLVDIFQHLPTWKVDFHFDRLEIFLIFQ